MSGELELLLNEVRLLFHQSSRLGEQLHVDAPVTIAMRAVLEFLENNGPSSVPVIAKSRHVSRQHVQVLVNDLIERGLARLEPNPAHERSRLVTLTAKGGRLFTGMRKRERKLFESATAELRMSRVRQATETIRDVRRVLEGRAS